MARRTRPQGDRNPLNIFPLSLFTLIVVIAAPATAQAQRVGLYVGSRALKVVRYDLQVRVQHPLARTTLTQEFENPTTRASEAYFYYRVPAAATLDDLALWVNGVRRPARVLERQKAREVYQGIVNQKRDPALVERLRGNLFRIRIFPVPAKRRTRVQLSFVQPLKRHADGSYRLRLQKAPVDVLRLSLALYGAGALRSARLRGHPGRLQRHGSGYRLPALARARRFAEDIVLDYQVREQASLAQASELDGRGHRYVVAELPRRAKGALPRLGLLIDRSASMTKHLPVAKRVAHTLLASLPDGAEVSLHPFDLLPRSKGQSARLSRVDDARRGELRQAVAALTAGRGSAFFPVFEAARRAGAKHLVLITDGATAGHQAELEQLVRETYDHRGDRRSVAVSVVLLDRQAATADPLRDLCRVSGGKLLVIDDAATVAQLGPLRQLALHSSTPAPRAVGGELELLRVDSDHLLVAARVPASASKLEVRLAGQTLQLPLGHRLADQEGAPRQQARPPNATAPGPRALWAAARIDRLYQQIRLFGETEALRRQIVALSRRHRVASEYTAFLVTEKDADYQRRTSGRVWQRKVKRLDDGTPSFHSTPEPHEWALLALGVLFIALASRRHRRGLVSRAG